MRSFLIRCTAVSAIMVTMCTAFLFYVYSSTQREPAFYREVLAVDPQEQASAGDAFESTAFELHNQLVSGQAWQASFTEDEVNGWLATDLVEKFPGALPRQIQAPRCRVRAGRILLVCRYEGDDFQGFVQLECEPFLAETENTLGLRICRLQSGLLPLPIHPWLDNVSKVAAQLGYPIRWSQSDGDPVALLALNWSGWTGTQHHRLERIVLEDGALTIAGTSATQQTPQVAEHDPHVEGQASRQ